MATLAVRLGNIDDSQNMLAGGDVRSAHQKLQKRMARYGHRAAVVLSTRFTRPLRFWTSASNPSATAARFRTPSTFLPELRERHEIPSDGNLVVCCQSGQRS